MKSEQVAASLAAWAIQVKKDGASPSDIFAATLGFAAAAAVTMGWTSEMLINSAKKGFDRMEQLNRARR